MAGNPASARGFTPGLGVAVVGVDPAAPKGHRLTGDVAFVEVAPKCRGITSVPGGVGPMTIAMLMAKTIASCRRFADRA